VATALQMKAGTDRLAEQAFVGHCRDIEHSIAERFNQYAGILRSAAALFDASDQVTPEMWHTFIARQNIAKYLPGIQGVGFNLLIPKPELKSHLNEVRELGFSDYQITPAGDRDVYTSILYIAPADERNLRAFGYDTFSEPVRRAAMELARDSGSGALTGKLTLVQETDQDVQAGVILYEPIYRQGLPTQTIEQRRAAIYGWASAPFRMNDLMLGTLGSSYPGKANIQLQIFAYVANSPVLEQNLLYTNIAASAQVQHKPLRFTHQIPLNLAGQTWLLSFSQTGGNVFAAEYARIWITFIGGILFSLLLFFLLRNMHNARKKIELVVAQRTATLSAQRLRLAGIIEGTDVGTWEWNVQTGAVQFNERWAEMVGYTLEELSPLSVDTWVKLMPPEDIHTSNALLKKHFSGELNYYSLECRMKHNQGDWVWVKVRGKVLSWTADGKPWLMYGTHTDITQRKQVEQERERLLRAIYQSSETIVMTDAEGIIQYVNPAFTQITGYSAQDALGKNPRILKSDQQDQTFYEQMWSTLTSGRTWSGSIVNKKKDGSLYTEDATISPVLNRAGEISNYVAVKRDITLEIAAEEKRLELEKQLRQKHKMEAVGYMAGGMAHNFNNNLAIILGNIELSEMKLASDSEVIPFLENAKISVRRSRDLIQKIITYSRQGAQRKTSTSLNAVLDETIRLLQSTMPTTVNLSHSCDLDCGTAVVNADPAQIQEVLINLYNNAIQAMQEKGDLNIVLEQVELKQEDIPVLYDQQPGRYAKISVEDSGCGIPAEMLDKIFDPFFSTKEEFEGAGMGLATVQGIVAQHGGMITVDSIPGEGTTFVLYLPLIADAGDTKSSAENYTLLRGSERILFVDDDEHIATLEGKMLTEMGYQVTTMASSRAALALFSAAPDNFDIIITDQTMPGLCGVDLIHEIKKIRANIPAILCTGYSSKVDESNAKEQGVRFFIMKPLELPKLLQKIRQVLDGDGS